MRSSSSTSVLTTRVGCGRRPGCGDRVCRTPEDLALDPENCGSCGNACDIGELCLAGTCVT